MIQSMTGYGRSVCKIGENQYSIEIKSLNHKQIDIGIKIPPYLREKEMIIRDLLLLHLQRGKIELYIGKESTEEGELYINKQIVKGYYRQLEDISGELNITQQEPLLSAILKLPDVITKQSPQLEKEEWNKISESIEEAIQMLIEHRKDEGKAMEKDIRGRVRFIKEHIQEICKFEPRRIEKIRDRIRKSLNEFLDVTKNDNERLEQEIIYYIEKLDINEEKVRLENHCEYFSEILNLDEPVGKKLNFIAQEMLREINTIGSKASDSDIQKIVITMKDELEKAKEQIMNVL
ncbi:MAG: YicC/YloC family endoribonuclease [Bacteroidota bacterium]